MRLLQATMTIKAELLGGDAAFAHHLSRSPSYTGDDPAAYHWHVELHCSVVPRTISLINRYLDIGLK